MAFFKSAYGTPGILGRADGYAVKEQECGLSRHQGEERYVEFKYVARLAHQVPDAASIFVIGGACISLGVESEIAVCEDVVKDFFGPVGVCGVIERHPVGRDTEMIDGDAGKEFPACGQTETADIGLKPGYIDVIIMGVEYQ